jgi:hypothetical protein
VHTFLINVTGQPRARHDRGRRRDAADRGVDPPDARHRLPRAYTTFSTSRAETVGSVAHGEPGMATALRVASVALGLGAAVAGLALGRAL